MKFTLVEDWKLILAKAWSVRFVALGLLLGLAEQVIPQLDGAIDHRLYIVLIGLVGAARILRQESMNGEPKK